MASLHYQNLKVLRPEILLKNAFYSLGMFFRFLDQTRKYMESDAAVKRLACKPGSMQEGEEAHVKEAVWVQLEEPSDQPNVPESTFRDFMDENLREVFDQRPIESEESLADNHNGRRKFTSELKIEVLDRDPETLQLLLARKPIGNHLLLRPNTYTLGRQIQAIQRLQNAPSPAHLPLLRLMESTRRAQWPSFKPAHIDNWLVLTDSARPGTSEQREFVQLAMSTPDFAFLEGPPGSGKTTAICELILQLAINGKRVLLCGSTHVAVDNVLERLMDERNLQRDLIIPIRIGERRSVSEKARPWQMENFVKSERERLLGHLNGQRSLSESQRELRDSLRHGTSAIERMVLDAANLVCGTTIGILQHPDIRRRDADATFDVLIVDEASKTTFQEFIVPALFAKRWIIIGDPKQLSPYVDDAAMAVNVESCQPSVAVRNACIDIYSAAMNNRKRRVAVVVTEAPESHQAYLAQAAKLNVGIANAANDAELWSAGVVIGNLENMHKREKELPLDVATVRAPRGQLTLLQRRVAAWLKIEKRSNEEQLEWANEVAWRIAGIYEQRFASHDTGTIKRLRRQLEELQPAPMTGFASDKVQGEIDRVRRVALPSILESLRHGFEREHGSRDGTALSDGLPKDVLAMRHKLLSTQHRMHADIASFSHAHIYDREALFTSAYIESERVWSYSRHAQRAVWVDVRGGFKRQSNSNSKEACEVMEELKAFDEWAETNARDDGRPWEAAVLTFYLGQEVEMREHLCRWTKQARAIRSFVRGPKQRPHLSIDLSTVDRFQGHEADLVVITFANDHATSFLQSPNRLNVALTRARYQRVIVGDRTAMARARDSVLGELAENEKWDRGVLGSHR